MSKPKDAAVTWETITVGPSKQFASLTLAGCYMNSTAKWNNSYAGFDATSKMGFHVIISPGPDDSYYVNDSGSHSRRWPSMVGWPPYEGNLLGPVIIEGEPGKPAPLLCTDGYGDGVLYYQKGLFNVGDCDATFRHLRFRGFRRQDGYGNYSALRFGDTFFNRTTWSNTLIIDDCEISQCDDGIMGGACPGMKVQISNTWLHDNGNGTGSCHNAYIGWVAELDVVNLLSTNCTIGHLLKSRAAVTNLTNVRLIGNGGTESACLDVPDAGVLTINGLVCQKSPTSDASWVIHYSGENQDSGNGVPFHVPSSVSITNLTMVAPKSLTNHPTWGISGFANQSGDGAAASGKGSFLVTPTVSGVEVFGLTAAQAGLACTILSSSPTLDLTPPTGTVTPPAPPAPPPPAPPAPPPPAPPAPPAPPVAAKHWWQWF